MKDTSVPSTTQDEETGSFREEIDNSGIDDKRSNGKLEDYSTLVKTTFARSQGTTLRWKDVNMTVGGSTGGEATEVVSNASGSVRPYRLTAILGHSGAGKTSLLNVLAGRVQASNNVEISGKLTLDGHSFNPSSSSDRRKVAFVAQQDTLNGTATPREMIWFSARMRLDRSVTDKEVAALTDALIEKLSLQKVAANLISCGRSNLSGGEKRRVSLGVELVVQPSLLLLDEVTSGLDSHNAMQVLKTLKAISQWSGTSILFTIHQPSSEMFGMIDDALLMRHGRCMYQGPVEKIRSYFAVRKHPVPPGFNVAEHILAVSQTAESDQELEEAGFFENFPIELERRQSLRRRSSVFEVFNGKISFLLQVWLLFRRALLSTLRDARGLMLQFGVVVGGGVVVALCYGGVGRNQESSMSSQAGALFLVVTSLLICVQIKVVEVASKMDVLKREYLTNHYGILSYSVAEFLFDCVKAPIILLPYLLVTFYAIGFQGGFLYLYGTGCFFCLVASSLGACMTSLFRDPSHALPFTTLALLPQQLLAGFMVAIPDLSPVIRWSAYIMPLTYTFRLSLSNEFASCGDVPEHRQLVNCARTAAMSGFDPYHIVTPFLQETTSLSLPQTGRYTTIQDIFEYLNLFQTRYGALNYSLADNGCFLKDTLQIVETDVSEDTCGFTVAMVQQYDIQEDFKSDGAESLQSVSGFKVVYEPSDPEDFKLDSLDVYFGGDDNFKEYFYNQINATKANMFVCSVLQNQCPGVFAQNQFYDFDDCVARMSELPMLEEDEVSGEVFLDSNSTGCRTIHATLASGDPFHCPHLSFAPMEDDDGQVKCHTSKRNTDLSTFGKKTITKFAGVGASYGLEHHAYEPIRYAERGQCLADGDFIKDVTSSLASIAPSEVLCMLYLDRQGATGDQNPLYFMILLGLLAAYLVVGGLLLRYRLNQSLIS